MAFTLTIATTHTKTLIAPSTGVADKVYGADYVSATSHTSALTVTDATSGGIPYFSSSSAIGTSALLAANAVVLGGGAGTAPLTQSDFTYSSGAVNLTNSSSRINLYSNADAGAIYSNAANFGIVFSSTTNNDLWLSGTSLRAAAAKIIGWTSGTDAVAGLDTGLSRSAAGIVAFGTGASGNGQAALFLSERTAPSAPAANGVHIYAVDNGAGKTQLMALFGSGAAQQIAIEP